MEKIKMIPETMIIHRDGTVADFVIAYSRYGRLVAATATAANQKDFLTWYGSDARIVSVQRRGGDVFSAGAAHMRFIADNCEDLLVEAGYLRRYKENGHKFFEWLD